MKYIRTQKELYKVMQMQICNTDKFVEVQRKKIGLFTGTTELISKDDIIGQADIIEELCDEFVIIKDKEQYALARYYSGDRTFYLRTEDEEVSLSECLRYEYKIFGAIWTEWGLKYVAKMNSNGELELL